MAPKTMPFRSLERGLDILRCFAGPNTPLSLTAIAEKTELPPSTTLRFMTALESKGFVHRDPGTKRYTLRSLQLAFHGPGGRLDTLASASLPFLQEIAAKHGESVGLFVPAGECCICIQLAESASSLRRVMETGDAIPGLGTASGKVLAAWREGVAPSLGLAKVRKAGYATNLGDCAEGVCAFAVPVFDRSGRAVAALTMFGPISRFPLQRAADIVQTLGAASAAIAAACGATPQG